MIVCIKLEYSFLLFLLLIHLDLAFKTMVIAVKKTANYPIHTATFIARNPFPIRKSVYVDQK